MRFTHFITILALGYVIWTLAQHGIWSDDTARTAFFHPSEPHLLLFALLGLPFNVGLEILKWRDLTVSGTKAWTRSAREVLLGCTFGMITPNRSGDAIARVAALPSSERANGARAWAMGAWAQAGWTLTIGTCAWWLLACFPEWAHGHTFAPPIILLAGAALTASMGAWWYLPSALSNRPSGWLHRRFPELKNRLPTRLRNRQIGWSALRYLVFGSQFALALGAWGFEWNGALCTTIALVYLGNMIVPTAALAELGVREALILAWMNPAPESTAPLVAATFSVWLINLCLPAIVGGSLQIWNPRD